jgi:formylglycine-generating enzyme required for sulfatase activity
VETDSSSADKRGGKKLPSTEYRARNKAQLALFPASRGRAMAFGLALVPDLVKDEAPAKRSGMCPAGMVMIGSDFCIDIYEGALVEMLEDGTERPFSPYHQVKGAKVRAVNGAGMVPQGYISGVEAKAACEASGKRLCKPQEWKKACMGPKKTTYPYGADLKKGVCNDHGRSSMLYYNNITDRPEDAYKWGHNGNMLDPRLNQLEGTLARSGEHPGCTNEYGVYDMVGNIHEWVDDPNGTFQGGYYLDIHLNMDGCHYETTAHDFKHKDYSTGFRCCADTED